MLSLSPQRSIIKKSRPPNQNSIASDAGSARCRRFPLFYWNPHLSELREILRQNETEWKRNWNELQMPRADMELDDFIPEWMTHCVVRSFRHWRRSKTRDHEMLIFVGKTVACCIFGILFAHGKLNGFLYAVRSQMCLLVLACRY